VQMVSILKEPGATGGLGFGLSAVAGGFVPHSAVTRLIRCRCGSSAMVRAPILVVTFSTTTNLPRPSLGLTIFADNTVARRRSD